jgi:hypothetical protein
MTKRQFIIQALENKWLYLSIAIEHNNFDWIRTAIKQTDNPPEYKKLAINYLRTVKLQAIEKAD